MTEHVSKKRINKMILIFMIMLVYSFSLGMLKRIVLDQLLCVVMLNLVFFAVLLFLLENQRINGRLNGNRTTDYNHILVGVIIVSAIGVLCGFLPEFIRPILAIVIVITGFSSEWIGLCISIYYSVILAIICKMSVYELLCYLMLALTCSMLFASWANKKLKKNFILSICCLQTVLPTIFYYLQYQEYVISILLSSLFLGIVLMIGLQIFYDKMYDIREHELDNILQSMLDEEYSAAKELRRFSVDEYAHAKLVSKVAREAARIAGADEILCAVAGFYYRIGILKGNQLAKLGELVAAEKCFPENVCQIIKEYYGVQELPSTLESAIVQMIDGILCRIEVMCANGELFDWNKDIIIYNTLAEFSSGGMYSKANLSMQKYIEIREYLVKEEPLYEFINGSRS